jgi:hypothetical protein
MLDRYQSLDTKVGSKYTFKSKIKPSIESCCEFLDRFKTGLLSDSTASDIKSEYFYILQRYLRDTQKYRCRPNDAHYFTVTRIIGEKQHLEHPIPQNRIISAYLDGDITALEAIHMPLCSIADADKHILQGEWEQNATWAYPFKRYKMAGFTKEIKNLRGEIIDPDTWSIEDHFGMLGVDKMVKDVNI